MDQACEYGYFLDGAHAQPAASRVAWADFLSVELVVLVRKNKKDYSIFVVCWPSGDLTTKIPPKKKAIFAFTHKMRGRNQNQLLTAML